MQVKTLVPRTGYHEPNTYAVYSRMLKNNKPEWFIQFCNSCGDIVPHKGVGAYGGYSKRQAASHACLLLNHPISEMFKKIKTAPFIVEATYETYTACVIKEHKRGYQLLILDNTGNIIVDEYRSFVQAIEYFLREKSLFSLYGVRWLPQEIEQLKQMRLYTADIAARKFQEGVKNEN